MVKRLRLISLLVAKMNIGSAVVVIIHHDCLLEHDFASADNVVIREEVMSQMKHYSVLLNESIEALDIKPDGIYIDGTFGRGGHSEKILAMLGSEGRLVAFDKDPQAIEYAEKYVDDQRFFIHHGSFTDMTSVLKNLEI